VASVRSRFGAVLGQLVDAGLKVGQLAVGLGADGLVDRLVDLGGLSGELACAGLQVDFDSLVNGSFHCKPRH
jgi:hypothetical protein